LSVIGSLMPSFKRRITACQTIFANQHRLRRRNKYFPECQLLRALFRGEQLAAGKWSAKFRFAGGDCELPDPFTEIYKVVGRASLLKPFELFLRGAKARMRVHRL
jgi:hypothetical protein